ARLVRSALDLGIPILTGTPARQLLREGARVVGAVTGQAGSEQRSEARRGVVLACGGFSHDLQRLRQAYPHVRRGGEHFSP
ncbi:3-oxosteroid 1-dehydrogenase, partial [Enterococcus faecium]